MDLEYANNCIDNIERDAYAMEDMAKELSKTLAVFTNENGHRQWEKLPNVTYDDGAVQKITALEKKIDANTRAYYTYLREIGVPVEDSYLTKWLDDVGEYLFEGVSEILSGHTMLYKVT